MIPRLTAVVLSLLVASIPASAAPSGPWAKYNGKFKADALFRDADGGYLDEIKSIVQGGGDLNWQREDGRTPLMSAAAAGHADIVAYMLSQGADATLRDQYGKTAQDLARAAGAMDVVRLLGQGAKAPVRPDQPAPAVVAAVSGCALGPDRGRQRFPCSENPAHRPGVRVLRQCHGWSRPEQLRSADWLGRKG